MRLCRYLSGTSSHCATPVSPLYHSSSYFHTWPPTWVRGGGSTTPISAPWSHPREKLRHARPVKHFSQHFSGPFLPVAGSGGRNLGINFWACEEAGGRVGPTNYWRLAHNEALKVCPGQKARQQNTTSLDTRNSRKTDPASPSVFFDASEMPWGTSLQGSMKHIQISYPFIQGNLVMLIGSYAKS